MENQTLNGAKQNTNNETEDDNKEEDGIHMHCLTCHSISCIKFKQCPIMHCEMQCGVQFHQCKQIEHQQVCRKQKRSCLNSRFGCPFKVTSIELLTHLERCPANVVFCSINWNRTPLFSLVCFIFPLIFPFSLLNREVKQASLDTAGCQHK